MEIYFSFLIKLTCAALIILGMMFSPQLVGAAAPTPKPTVCWVIDAELVNSLLLPKNPEELRRAYKNLLYHDVVLDMLYYKRLRAMKHTEKDDLDFLRSMPKNPVEFSYLYSVTSPEDKLYLIPLNAAYQTYFEDLGDLVIKHPEFLEAYFLQVYFSDGEIADRLETTIAKIHKAIPKEFGSALKKVPAKVRARICTDC